MNLFYHAGPEKLDKQYLRICSVYRLMRKKLVNKDRAIELLAARGVKNARQTVETWEFK